MSNTYYRFLTDEQWARVEPHLPPQPAVGRKRADDRRTLNAILFVLRTGIQWNTLPKELGDDSTAHRRLKQWRADGTFIPSKGGAPK